MILTGDGDTGIISNALVTNAGYLQAYTGVYLSFDGGINWYPAAAFPGGNVNLGFNKVADPNDPNIVLAATDAGIFRTENFGGSWTLTTGYLPDQPVFEVKFRPGDSNIAYATQAGQFYRSTDGGQTWNLITNFDIPMPAGRVALSVNPGSVNRVYLVCGTGNDTGATFSGMYLSTNAGNSFTRQSNTPNIIANVMAWEEEARLFMTLPS